MEKQTPNRSLAFGDEFFLHTMRVARIGVLPVVANLVRQFRKTDRLEAYPTLKPRDRSSANLVVEQEFLRVDQGPNDVFESFASILFRLDIRTCNL